MRRFALLTAFVSFTSIGCNYGGTTPDEGLGAEIQAMHRAAIQVPLLTTNPGTPYETLAAGTCTITQVGGAFTVTGNAGGRFEVPAPATYRITCRPSLQDLREELFEETEITVADDDEVTVPLFFDTVVIAAHVEQRIGASISYPDLTVTVTREDGLMTTIRSGADPFRGPRNVFAAGHTYTLTATLGGVTVNRTATPAAGTKWQARFRFRM